MLVPCFENNKIFIFCISVLWNKNFRGGKLFSNKFILRKKIIQESITLSVIITIHSPAAGSPQNCNDKNVHPLKPTADKSFFRTSISLLTVPERKWDAKAGGKDRTNSSITKYLHKTWNYIFTCLNFRKEKFQDTCFITRRWD